jgi:tetratricopeptide (TPR) repeat protein
MCALISRPLAAVTLMAFLAAFSIAAPVPKKLSDEELKARAIKLNELTSKDAMQTKLSEYIKDKDNTKRMVTLAAKLQKEAKEKEAPFKFNAAFVLGKLAHNGKDYDSAELFYEFCMDNATKLRSGQKMLDAVEGLMDLYWDQKKYNGVEQVAQKFIESKGGQVDFPTLLVMEKLAQAKAKQGEVDEALKVADGLTQLPRIGAFFLQTKGSIYRDANKLGDAIATYEDFLDKIDDLKEVFEPEMLSRMKKSTRYMMTGLYVDNKQVDKAATILEKLIKDDPENPTYYNDLGFVWCDHDMKLDKAEQLIRKALELDTKQRKKLLEEGKISEELAKQENAAYLDSLGWVLYKQKKYAEAVELLKKASQDEDEGQHLEIWDHLADGLIALGKKQEALEVLTKALKFEDIGPRDKERRKKITEKLKKLKAEIK